MIHPYRDARRRRLARQLREAALQATSEELLAVDALESAVHAGYLDIVEASWRLTMILRAQHERCVRAGPELIPGAYGR